MEPIYNTTWDVTYPTAKPKGRNPAPKARKIVENISVRGDIGIAATNRMYLKRVLGRLPISVALMDYAIENIKVNDIKIICKL